MRFPGAAVWAACFVLAACAEVPPASEKAGLEGTAWTLAALPQRAPASGSYPVLRFEGGRVQGNDGCNRFAATYVATGSALRFDPHAFGTRHACDRATTAQGEAFLRAMSDTRAYRVANGQLQLLGPDGALVATLAPHAQGLVDTSWRVTGVNNGRQAVASVLAGTTLTMTFSSDSRVSGSAGCNRYSAAYSGDGPKLQIVPVGSTRMTCAEPEGVMEQEQQFLSALPTVATARFDGNRLELRTAEGALAIALTRDSSR